MSIKLYLHSSRAGISAGLRQAEWGHVRQFLAWPQGLGGTKTPGPVMPKLPSAPRADNLSHPHSRSVSHREGHPAQGGGQGLVLSQAGLEGRDLLAVGAQLGQHDGELGTHNLAALEQLLHLHPTPYVRDTA